jgi:hypothetical protein
MELNDESKDVTPLAETAKTAETAKPAQTAKAAQTAKTAKSADKDEEAAPAEEAEIASDVAAYKAKIDDEVVDDQLEVEKEAASDEAASEEAASDEREAEIHEIYSSAYEPFDSGEVEQQSLLRRLTPYLTVAGILLILRIVVYSLRRRRR